MKVSQSGGKILFSFEGAENILFDSAKVHASLHSVAEMHGWEQRLRDNAAIARKQKDGTIITVTEAMRRAAVLELVEHYESGSEKWAIRTAGFAAQNATWLAIAEKRGVDYATVAAEYAQKALDDLAALA